MIVRRKLRISLILIVMAVTSLGCNLARLAQNAEATQTAQITAQALGTLPAPTAVASAADEPAVIGDIHLTSADLPAGFVPVSEDQMAQMGISSQSFSSSITAVLNGATTRNTDAFINPATNEVVIAAIIAPLNALERTAFDLYLSDPQRVLDEIQGQAESTTVSQNTAVAVGDSSVAFNSLTERAYLSLAGQGVISRRGSVIQVTLLFYPQGVAPAASASAVANTLDTKISAAQ